MSDERYVVFCANERIGEGALADTARAAWPRRNEAVLVFDRSTGRVVDLDLRGGEAEVAARHRPADQAPSRGRPKLGVVAREVTLLPRHWEWLAAQPGGASTALRKLVEAARKADAGAARQRAEAAYRFMSAMAGDAPGFEEASRALFAGDRSALEAHMAVWPADVRDETMRFLTDGG